MCDVHRCHVILRDRCLLSEIQEARDCIEIRRGDSGRAHRQQESGHPAEIREDRGGTPPVLGDGFLGAPQTPGKVRTETQHPGLPHQEIDEDGAPR